MDNRSGRLGERRDENGAVAIMVAVWLTSLLVVAAMVLDFGLARLDRQVDKSAADDAVAAGMQSMNKGDGQMYPFRGVCTAIDFLNANLTLSSALSWSSCNSAAGLLDKVCSPTDSSTWASYSGSIDGYHIWIKSPYSLPDSAFPEDSSLNSLSADTGDDVCDQLAVIITKQRKPGLGSLATSGDLATTVRSVGRAVANPGEVAPALLLLERSKCSVLTVGSSGSPSHIVVEGSGSVPGTVHADSKATDAGSCGTNPNKQVFQGNQASGIVAYGAADGTSGTITSVAKYLGRADGIVSDGIANVYGTTGYYPASGTPTGVTGHKSVTRKPVDARYLAGVTTAVRGAYSQWTLAHASPTGYTNAYGCPTATQMTAMSLLSPSASVYIDCPTNSGITLNGTINAGTVYFHGYIKGGNLKLPYATAVYIDDTDNSGARVNDDAIVLNNNDSFCVRAPSCITSTPTSGQCSTLPTGSTTAQARLFIRRGKLNGAGGSSLLRLCNTTVISEGGQLGDGSATNPGGCLPLTWGTAPNMAPCVGATDSRGSGQINTSGYVDWTAPNAYEDMDAAGYTSHAQKQVLWDGGEDLALWTESYGDTNTGYTFAMAGGGHMHVAGVFMAPNAAPFQISGSGNQDLSNAQYIVTKFSVDGNATLTMRVDPYNAIPEPDYSNTLVR